MHILAVGDDLGSYFQAIWDYSGMQKFIQLNFRHNFRVQRLHLQYSIQNFRFVNELNSWFSAVADSGLLIFYYEIEKGLVDRYY